MLPRLSYNRPSYFSTCQEVPREDSKRREGWPQKGGQHSKLHLTYYFSKPNYISRTISASFGFSCRYSPVSTVTMLRAGPPKNRSLMLGASTRDLSPS